jgi:DNA repair protein RecO (recombination protein O)
MEWEAPAIVLDARPFSEGDALITVMTAEHGAHRGLVKGGAARAHVATWQRGNFVKVRWTARLSDQLGRLSGETIHANAAHIMDDATALAMLASACAVAEGALAERAPHPAVFEGLLRLIARLPLGVRAMPDLIRWELTLLAELGYGLDLSRCAVSGVNAGLAYVSPRTGRAVTRAAAGDWVERLLPLPGFLAEPKTNAEPEPDDLRDGLRLTGHFLARDAFGARHRPLPQARVMLYDRFAASTAESETKHAG